MCIDIEPNIFVSEKALDNLQNGFDFYDRVEIETQTIEEKRINWLIQEQEKAGLL